jgi:hypothetical protein
VGNTVAVSHAGRILSRYQHMKNGSVRVKPGDAVKKGQTLGIMGTTGRSTAIHLHLGIKENSTAWNNGTWVDPLPYLTGAKKIAGAAGAGVPVPETGAAAEKAQIRAGDKVRVRRPVQWNGVPFRAWQDVYDVIQVRGDGAVVIGAGRIVTAAVRAEDLERI